MAEEAFVFWEDKEVARWAIGAGRCLLTFGPLDDGSDLAQIVLLVVGGPHLGDGNFRDTGSTRETGHGP